MTRRHSDLSPKEQEDLTIAYAMLLGSDLRRQRWPATKYVRAVRFLEGLGYFLHSNGVLMAIKGSD